MSISIVSNKNCLVKQDMNCLDSSENFAHVFKEVLFVFMKFAATL